MPDGISDQLPIRAYFGGLNDVLVPLLASSVPDERFVPWPDETPSDILIGLPFDPEGLRAAITPDIRWVHMLGTGVDGFPMDAAGDRVVSCSRGASSVAISEFVLAAMLAFEKRLPDTWLDAPPERWSIAALGGLKGRTLGLVGIGAIGSEVARRALAFDMRVLALRRSSAPPPVDGIEPAASLPELLGQADHVVIAAPATPETHHLFDREAFAAVKPGVHIVNVARGSLVDQDALIEALDAGRVAMASLDVCDPEPLPAGHALYTHPLVRLSSHVSWSSPDTLQMMIQYFIDNIRRYRSGEALHGVVDTAAGY